MKKLSTIVCCLGLLMFAGCEKAGIEGKSTIGRPERFPAVMVGRWESKTAQVIWVFDIRPDGSIPQMFHPWTGKVEFTQDEAHIEVNRPASSREYFLAPCQAEYDPATDEVSIEVVVDYYRIQTAGALVEGGRTDVFKGALSKDGKTWNADWLTSLEFEGKKPIKPRKPYPIVFTKVDAR